MKGLITLFLAVGLILGVSNAYAQETNVHLWVYGTDATDIASILTGQGLGIPAPILYSEHAFPGWRFSEETIALDDFGFAFPGYGFHSSKVDNPQGLSLVDMAKRVQEKNGINNIYRELMLIRYPDTVVLFGGD